MMLARLTEPDALGLRRDAICAISGLGLISAPSGWKWCSVSQNDWKPSFSARMPWRTWLTSVSCAAR